MKRSAFCLTFLILVLTACNPATMPTQTSTTPQQVATRAFTQEPSATNTPIPTNTPTFTLTPDGGIPQVYIGISDNAIDWYGCAGGGIITMDYAEEKGITRTFWQEHGDLPVQENAYVRSRDGRGNADICIYPDQPIVFQMDEGNVLENRINNIDDNMVVLKIEIIKGYGSGYELVWAHLNPDLDLSTDTLEYLEPGTKVYFGDLLGYTNQDFFQKYSVLNFGIINPNAPQSEQEVNGFGYWKLQELSYIGFDGQINLQKP